MKKLLSGALATLVLVFCMMILTFAEEVKPVAVTLNGEIIDCAYYGQQATIVDGRTMVPLRAIFEELGAVVEWNPNTKTVTSTIADVKVKLTIGEKVLYKNGEKIELDVPALIMNGRTLVPVRAVSEAYDVAVEWDKETRTVMLSKEGYLRGKVRENVYTSKWLNMKFTCPDGFSYADEEYLRDVLETSADMSLENIDISSVMSMYEFAILDKTNVSLTVSKNSSDMTKKQYAKDAFCAFRTWNLEFDAADFYTAEIAGMEFDCYESSVKVGEGSIGVIVHVAEKEGYFVTLSVLYFDRADYEKLMSSFEVLSETPKQQEKLYTFDEMLLILSENTAKSEQDTQILAKFGDIKVSASVVKYASAYARYLGLEGKEFASFVKDSVKEFIAIEYAIRQGEIKYNEADLKLLLQDIETIKDFYGDDAVTVLENSEFSSMYNYFYQQLIENSASKVLGQKKDDSRFMKKVYAKTLSEIEKGDYVRAKHILIQANKSDREEKLAEINEILSLVNRNPDSFDLYIETFGEDPGVEAYPGGYVFTKGEMVEPFEKVAYSLAEGSVSGIVETDYGFHIIQRLPITTEDFDTTSGYVSGWFSSVVKETLVETIVDDSKDSFVVYSVDFLEKSNQYADEFSALYS